MDLAKTLQAGLGLHQAGRLDHAEAEYRRVLAVRPDQPDALLLLGILLVQKLRHDEAVPVLTRAAAVRPQEPTVHNTLGMALRSLGRRDEARAAFERVLALEPSHAEAQNGLGILLHEQGRVPEALACYRAALAADPALADAWNNLGNGLLETGRADEALSAFASALRVHPAFDDAENGRGNALLALGRAEGAVEAYGRALALNPSNAKARNNLGVVLKRLDRLDQAADCFRAALDLDPAFAEAADNLGNALAEAGDTDQALAAYDQSLALRFEPGTAVRRALLLPVIPLSGQGIEASRADLSRRLDDLAGRGLRLTDPYKEVGQTAFYLAYHGRDDKPLLRKLTELLASACPDLVQVAPHCRRPRPTSGRVRLGVCSAFLHEHTIGKLNRGLLLNLDRERFHLTLFRPGGREDALSAAFEAAADAAVRLPDDLPAARQAMAGAECEVLFYPDLGMDPLTWFLAFARLAPVQCATWGHPSTTALPHLDYFLSSEALEPEGSETLYTEKLVRLPRLGVCYEPPALPGLRPSKADFGLPTDRRCYLCPQSLFKLHPDFDPALARILELDPGADLVFLSGKHPAWETILRERFHRSFSPDPARIVFLPRVSPSDYLDLLACADALIDTFHFGGGNTTLEALAVGAPVVTLPSAMLRGRISLAIYRQMGLETLVARDPEDFSNLAVRLALEPDFKLHLKNEIAARRDRIFNDLDAVRLLENFFRDAARKGRP